MILRNPFSTKGQVAHASPWMEANHWLVRAEWTWRGSASAIRTLTSSKYISFEVPGFLLDFGNQVVGDHRFSIALALQDRKAILVVGIDLRGFREWSGLMKLPPQGMLNHGFQRGPSLHGHGLCLEQQIIREFDSRLHPRIWVMIRAYRWASRWEGQALICRVPQNNGGRSPHNAPAPDRDPPARAGPSGQARASGHLTSRPLP